MVIDDEEMLRTVAKAQLTALGHDTILVPDGEQAITSYQEQQKNGTPVDLVIMDLTIPDGMGGQEATEKLLKNLIQTRKLSLPVAIQMIR